MDEQVQLYLDNEMWEHIHQDNSGEWVMNSTQRKKSDSNKFTPKEKRNTHWTKRTVRIVRRGNIMNEKYREIFNDKTTMYDYLLTNIVRGEMINDKLNILKDYYQNQQLLACAFPRDFLSKECNISVYKVRKYIQELKDKKVIRVETKNIGSHTYNIYILGTYSYFNGEKRERLYLDNVIENDK